MFTTLHARAKELLLSTKLSVAPRPVGSAGVPRTSSPAPSRSTSSAALSSSSAAKARSPPMMSSSPRSRRSARPRCSGPRAPSARPPRSPSRWSRARPSSGASPPGASSSYRRVLENDPTHAAQAGAAPRRCWRSSNTATAVASRAPTAAPAAAPALEVRARDEMFYRAQTELQSLQAAVEAQKGRALLAILPRKLLE